MVEVRREIENNEICGTLARIEDEAKHSYKTLTLDFISEGRRARTFTDRNGGGRGITKGWEIDEDGNLVREIGDKIATCLWLIDGTKTES